MNAKKWFFVVLGFVAIGVAAALSYRYWRVSALSFDCSNETLQETSSPDGRYAATVFERSCGATTPYYRVVALRPADTRFDPDKHEDWVFVSKGQPDVRLKWPERRHLDILSNGNDENMHKVWRDVEIAPKVSTP